MQEAIDMLSRVGELSDRVIEYLHAKLVCREYLKREFLLRVHRPCNHLWFIVRGLVGSFYEKGDKMHTGWILSEGDIASSIPAFYLRIPSDESLQALEDTVTCALHYDDLQYIYQAFPEFNWHGRVLTEKYYVMTEQRMRAFHNQPPAEKYKYLLNHFPELVQKVSNAHLAGFIGVSQETLSRVKSRKLWT